MTQPILYETHMHTPLCRHAVGEPEAYAAVALARGFKGIIVTCHNPLPDGLAHWARMYPEQFPDYVALVARAREQTSGQLDVLLGMECDYLPGLEGFLKEQLASEEFHHVLGSVHPMLSEYKERYFKGDYFEYQNYYFEHLAMAAQSGLFDTLAHPDLVKNFPPEQWNLDAIFPSIERALDRIAATGVAMELNTSGRNKALPEMNPGPRMLQAMARRGIPIVIGSDAHDPRRVGEGWEDALDLLEAAGYREINYFVERRRHSVPIDTARASLVPL